MNQSLVSHLATAWRSKKFEPTEPVLSDDPLMRIIDFAVDTGIPDLAENADHYLYGFPKEVDDR